jgi:hypothetical protein
LKEVGSGKGSSDPFFKVDATITFRSCKYQSRHDNLHDLNFITKIYLSESSSEPALAGKSESKSKVGVHAEPGRVPVHDSKHQSRNHSPKSDDDGTAWNIRPLCSPRVPAVTHFPGTPECTSILPVVDSSVAKDDFGEFTIAVSHVRTAVSTPEPKVCGISVTTSNPETIAWVADVPINDSIEDPVSEPIACVADVTSIDPTACDAELSILDCNACTSTAKVPILTPSGNVSKGLTSPNSKSLSRPTTPTPITIGDLSIGLSQIFTNPISHFDLIRAFPGMGMTDSEVIVAMASKS